MEEQGNKMRENDMLSNYHTHTDFCDGNNTAEEMVVSAIEKGFSFLGFSGHGYTDFDTSYCITEEDAYRKQILCLKDKYKDKIQIYLGTEEDATCLVNRDKYDYIIGSLHYFIIDGRYYSADMSYENMLNCISLLGGDAMALAENYYRTFCDYIVSRKPDIVGHFDLITKFDEKYEPLFLGKTEYNRIAEKYLKYAVSSGSIFEVNTGAISRGYRKTPYPAVNLLHILKKENAPIILSSDSHCTDGLDCAFTETRELLKDIGFKDICTLADGRFVKISI